MRLTSAVPLVLTAVAIGCNPTAPPSPPRSPTTTTPAHAPVATTAEAPRDLTIDIALAPAEGGKKCVVTFVDPAFKEAGTAIAWTAHSIVWQVQSNGCGEKKSKLAGKALGLRHMKLRRTGEAATWIDRCSKLHLIPTTIRTPLQLRCEIPSAQGGDWQPDELERVYEYEIEGDEIEPLDPDIGIKKNG